MPIFSEITFSSSSIYLDCLPCKIWPLEVFLSMKFDVSCYSKVFDVLLFWRLAGPPGKKLILFKSAEFDDCTGKGGVDFDLNGL